jgi:hypothetical protein
MKPLLLTSCHDLFTYFVGNIAFVARFVSIPYADDAERQLDGQCLTVVDEKWTFSGHEIYKTKRILDVVRSN